MPNPVPTNLTIHCMDRSLFKADSWLWDFGDGTTSSLQNPTHTYSTQGVYTVSLTATSGTKTSTTTHTVQAISISGGAVISGLTVSFTGFGAGPWFWDFGDGTTSTSRNPTHTYSTPGSKKVVQNTTVDNNPVKLSQNLTAQTSPCAGLACAIACRANILQCCPFLGGGSCYTGPLDPSSCVTVNSSIPCPGYDPAYSQITAEFQATASCLTAGHTYKVTVHLCRVDDCAGITSDVVFDFTASATSEVLAWTAIPDPSALEAPGWQVTGCDICETSSYGACI